MYEEFDLIGGKKASFLRTQLNIVDRAIGKIISSDGSSRVSSASHTEDFNTTIHFDSTNERVDYSFEDSSFKIDTSSRQFATCPNCLQEVPSRKLRNHILQDCKFKMIICPEPNCGVSLCQKDLKAHLMNDCKVYRNRKNLLMNRKTRIEGLVESRINENKALLEKSLNIPQSSEASNSHLIQSERSQPQHEQSNESKDEYFEICKDCGEAMKASQMKLHLEEKCIMRQIMCPNYHSGCRRRDIPLMHLQDHLNHECFVEKHRQKMVEQSNHRRELIRCPACGQSVPLMDMRRHDLELCENRLVHCRNHSLGCNVMVRLKERNDHEYVDGKKNARYAVYFPGNASHVFLNEDDIPSPWTVEAWIYRTSSLDSFRSHTRNVFLGFNVYFQAFAIESLIRADVLEIVYQLNASSVMDQKLNDNMKDMTKEEKNRLKFEMAQQKIELVNRLSSLVSIYSQSVVNFLRAFQSLAISIETALDCALEVKMKPVNYDPEVSFNLLPIFPILDDERGNSANLLDPVSKNDLEKNIEKTDANVDAGESEFLLESQKEEINDWDDDYWPEEDNNFESDTNSKDPKNEESEEKEANSIEIDQHNTDATNSSPRHYDDGLDSRESNPSDIIDQQTGDYDSKVNSDENSDGLRLQSDIVSSFKSFYFHRESALSRLFGFCLFVYMKNILKQTDLEDNLAESIYTTEEELCSIGFASDDLEIVDNIDLAQIVISFMLEPTQLFKSSRRTLKEWEKILHLFIKALKLDMKALQKWRIKTGLIKLPKDSMNSVDSLEQNEVQRKSILKKEKEKKRRELKKKKKSLIVDASATVDSNTIGEVKEPSKSEAEDRLIKTATELIKANTGTDVILDSSLSTPKEYRNRVCLNLNSGLSLFYPHPSASNKPKGPLGTKNDEGPDSKSDALLEEDLMYGLISANDRNTLLKSKGRAGIICASPESKESFSFSTEIIDFGLTIYRQQWTHLAFVTTNDDSQNRLAFYHNGGLIKNIKNAAFPLPMESFGGSPHTIHSFVGALLDVRYWSVPKSSIQVKDSMHSLVELSKKSINQSNESKINSTQSDRSQVSTNVTSDGLIGWWTFEDGPSFKSVMDVTRHRFRSPFNRGFKNLGLSQFNTLNQLMNDNIQQLLSIKGIESDAPLKFISIESNSLVLKSVLDKLDIHKWINAESVPILSSSGNEFIREKENLLLPIPSHKQQCLCPYEIKRFKLALSGRDLQREVDCTLGCGMKVRAMDLRFHTKFQCVKRLVKCRFDFCNSLFSFEKRAFHEANECALILARNKILSKAELENTLFPCTQCSLRIPQRKLDAHMKNQCQFRLISCPYDDCQSKNFPAFRLKNHLQFECSSPSRRENYIMIEKARRRQNYARPWGIPIPDTGIYTHTDEDREDSQIKESVDTEIESKNSQEYKDFEVESNHDDLSSANLNIQD